MFHWFQGLLPKQGNFFGLFEAHGATLVAGSAALVQLVEGGPNVATHIAEIARLENEADVITRDVVQTVRRVFLTPFDRSAITALISSMDDAIDQMHQTGRSVELYGVTGFEDEMREMAAIIAESAKLLAEALPLLRTISASGPRLHEMTERMVQLEGRADALHDQGLKKAFATHGKEAGMAFFVTREIYSHLERVVDKFEDVANEIDGLVIDHA